MGLSVSLINATPNELVYLITNTSADGGLGTAVTITANESFTPNSVDLVIDSAVTTWGRAVCARLRQVCRAGLDGLGAVAAGAWTQAQVRDLLLGNGATQAGGPLMPRAELDLQPRTGVAGGLLVEADVDEDGSGIPEINLTTAAVAGTAILRVRLRSTPGVR